MMKYGPYHDFYANSFSLWENHVGVMVEEFLNQVSRGSLVIPNTKVLDIGGGEGGNALFLAEQGFTVDLLEISPAAKKNFLNRVCEYSRVTSERINFQLGSILDKQISSGYGVVIAYGLLHCFSSEQEAFKVKIKATDCLAPGGVIIISCITNDIVIDPLAHPSMTDCWFPSKADLLLWMNGFLQIMAEVEVVEEIHGIYGVKHQHYIFRGIFQKPL